MDADYHHTVLTKATPSGDFTKRCHLNHTSRVRKTDPPEDARQQKRRAALQAYIDRHFTKPGASTGSVNGFATTIKMPQPQIADMLRGKKAFGEKVAERIERLTLDAKLPPIDLDSRAVSETQGYRVRYWPFDIEIERFDQLPKNIKAKLGDWVERAVLDHEERTSTQPRRRKNG